MIPNEYGIDVDGKLKIGSKICTNLLGKILSDLQNMREESLATAVFFLLPLPHIYTNFRINVWNLSCSLLLLSLGQSQWQCNAVQKCNCWKIESTHRDVSLSDR